MRLLRVSLLLLLCGCASHENLNEEAPSRDGEPREVVWREYSWDEVSDWLASNQDCHRSDGAFGYECFNATSRTERIGRAEVWFSPFFGEWAPRRHEALTILCKNGTRGLLKIKGFPACCKGIELSGRFDTSDIVMRDSVEYFCSEATEEPYEAYDDLPRFNATSKLKYLSIVRCDSGDERRKRLRIPSLDMSRFSELDNLEEVRVYVRGLVLHAEKLLDHDKLRNLSISEHYYDYHPDSYEEQIEAFQNLYRIRATTVRQDFDVDDSSFDGFIKRDFAEIKRMRVNIELSRVRTWDIAHLANLHMVDLQITTKNCMVAGVEAFQEGKGASHLSIYMDVAKGP